MGRRPMVVAIAIALGISVGFFFLLLRPKLGQISEVREQIVAAQEEERTLQADLARLQLVRRDAPETRARLARMSDLLPSAPELPSFIRLLQAAATAESIDLRSIAPTPPSPESDQIETIDVSLLIEGSFHQTEAFLARLENLKRLVEVTSVAIAPGESAERFTLASTLTLTMYVFREAA